jgi:hypothetical protein
VQPLVALTHCFAVTEPEAVHGVWVPFEQLAVARMVWHVLSRARNENVLLLVPLTRTIRASSVPPALANAAMVPPSTVHVNEQPVWPLTDAV